MGGQSQSTKTHPIEVIGLGMGGSLSRSEMERIVSADVMAGGSRLLERFAHLPSQRIIISTPLSGAMDRIEQARKRGESVVVLADGDPLFFGIGATLLERFGRDALHFTPGISAVQAACARIGLAWNDLPVVSLHGRSDSSPIMAALASKGRVAVYTDSENTPASVARLLVERGLATAAVWVLEDLGAPGERVRRFSPAEAAQDAFSPLNLVIIEASSAQNGPPVLGQVDVSYEKQAGLITKWPARACALAMLRLTRDGVLWDVGAGCGSVGIEACSLMPLGRVFAVERDPERHTSIRENIRRCGAWQVKAVKGEAPEAFIGLPDPDRIFVGGSLGGGIAALDQACRRLKPGGRVVANTVLLGSLNLAVGHFRNLGWVMETTQIQASHCSPLAADLHLVADNPVFIIAADKPA